jgi:hypothetical protein
MLEVGHVNQVDPAEEINFYSAFLSKIFIPGNLENEFYNLMNTNRMSL